MSDCSPYCRGYNPNTCNCTAAKAERTARAIERSVAAQHPGIAPWFVIRTWRIAEGIDRWP